MKTLIEQVVKNVESSGVKVYTTTEAMIAMNSDPTSVFTSSASYNQRLITYTESITMNPRVIKTIDWETPQQLRVLFHEMGHATGNKFRLKRPGIRGSEHELYRRGVITRDEFYKTINIEEMIAETCSVKCLAYLGVTDAAVKEESAIYIETFTRRAQATETDKQWVESQAEAAFQFILEKWLQPAINSIQEQKAA